MKKKLSFLMIALVGLAAFAGLRRASTPDLAPTAYDEGWVETAFGDLATNDVVVIVDKNSEKAMSNDKGTTAAPTATAVTFNDGKTQLTGDVPANIQWTVTVGESGIQFGADEKNHLYCTNSNNGVRVGTGDNYVFAWEQDGGTSNYYLKNNGTTNPRWIGVYTGSDWRCYTSVNSNINKTVTAFYKKTMVPVPVARPVFSVPGGVYTKAQSVALSAQPADAEIYYTLDGTEPTASSTKYENPIEVSVETTIKAIAIKGEDKSKVATATYTFVESIANTENTAYTIAEAINLIDTKSDDVLSHPDNKVYVKGIVSKVDSYDSKDKAITYWISADGLTTSQQFEVYAGKGLAGADFASIDDVTICASVIGFGNIKKYTPKEGDPIYEFDKGNVLAQYTSPFPADAVWSGVFKEWTEGVPVAADKFASLKAGDNLEIGVVKILEAGGDINVMTGTKQLIWTDKEGVATITVTGAMAEAIKKDGLTINVQKMLAYIRIAATETPASETSVWIGEQVITGSWSGGVKFDKNIFNFAPAVAGKVLKLKAHEPAAGARANRALADIVVKLKDKDWADFNPEVFGTAVADGYEFALTDAIAEEINANGFVIQASGSITITEVDLVQYYNISIADGMVGGNVVPDKYLAAAGDEITLTVTPDEGYLLTSLNVMAGEDPVAVTNNKFTMPAADVYVSATFAQPENVVISPEPGDLTAALAAAIEGKLVKNITMNLKAGAYTVSAPINVPGGLTINGNGATIDGSALTTPMIQMSTTPTVGVNAKDAYLSDGIVVKDVKITGLKYQFIYGNKMKYLLAKLSVENSIIAVDGTNKKTIFDFNGGGNASEIIIDKSTVYANPSNEQNGGLFSSQSGHGSIQDLGSDKQLFAITNSTIYNVAYAKTTSSQRRNNTSGMEYKVENSIIVNSGKSGQFIVGLNGGAANSVQTYTVSNNVFNFDGAETSAAEEAKVKEKIAEFAMTSINGVVTFTDAANGNFNGTLTLSEGASAPAALPGDPRWSVKIPSEDIVISPASGDISEALQTAIAGKVVGNITINLTADVTYTITNTIDVPAGLTINGNGATIDGSALTTPMIQMSGSMSLDKNEKDAWLSDGIVVKDVKVTGLKYQFIYGNKLKYLLAKLLVENSIIAVDGTNKKTIFDFNGGGNASEIIINKSTIYANPSNEQNGGLFSSQSGHGSIQDLGSDKQLFAITNSTIYNVAYAKTTSSQRRNNTAGMEYKVENSIIVNSGKNGQFIVGLNGGAANSVQTYTASNNVFNFDGAETSAAEEAKVQEKITEFAMTSINGVVTFTDAAIGNFNGTLTLSEGASAPAALPGDPRWTLSTVASYAITKAATEHGTFVVKVADAEVTYAAAETAVAIIATPDADYEVDAVTVKDADEADVTVTKLLGQDNAYGFTMPAKAVTVTVTFKEKGGTGIKVVEADALENAVIYNMQGVRVEKAEKGLYIVNGRKVVIK